MEDISWITVKYHFILNVVLSSLSDVEKEVITKRFLITFAVGFSSDKSICQ